MYLVPRGLPLVYVDRSIALSDDCRLPSVLSTNRPAATTTLSGGAFTMMCSDRNLARSDLQYLAMQGSLKNCGGEDTVILSNTSDRASGVCASFSRP